MKICFGCFEQYDDSFDICPHCGYAEGTEPELATYMRPGAILNERYVIGRALGHGGFSVTYLAWDALLLHKVAIKEYLPSEYATRRPGESRLTIFSGKEGEYFQFGKEKFLDEAKRLSAFQNEDGIVHVYDCFSANETAYLVMEYLDGITLSEYLKKEAAVSPQGRIAPEEAISMLTPVMLSLQRVHDSGMIHRDIAPDNIMLLKDGGVRLIDFGAARHAVHDCGKSMTVIIKDGYSPEEQYNSHSVQGPAADVYALSATLYQMITGITPPGAIERGEYLQKHKRDMLPPPSKFNKAVTKTQDTAILNGMALHTQDRTQSVAELYEELTAQTPVRRVQETIRKRSSFSWPLWAKITAGVLAAAIVAGGVLLYLNRKPKTDTAAEDGSYVLSPNVVNMQVVNAVTAAEDASLHLVVEGSDYDAGVEQGRILTQNPDPGTKLAPASDLLATASLGKERPVGVMDDMSSMLKDAAEDHLTRMGLSDVQINWEYIASDDEMPGTIVSQSVTAGSTLTPSSNVTISVAQPSQTPVTPVPTTPSNGSSSSGSSSSVDISELVPSEDSYVTVRDYVGQSFDTAKADLRTVSLYGVKCELRYHPSIPSGSIIQQSPEGGEKILKGSGVYFVVSLGPQKQLVPNVLYKEQGEAERLLAQSGFGSAPKAVTSSYVAPGHVAAQTPLGGSEAAPGTKISLDISSDSTSQPTQSNVTIDQFKAELDLQVGKSFNLANSLQYSGRGVSVVWSSSDPSSVTVDKSGRIEAVAPGASTITVVVGGEAASCYVTVHDNQPLEMTGSVILEVGEKLPLNQQLGNINATSVYWISSDPRVATVTNNGMLTGVSEGFAFVTALYAGQVKQCTVWVLDSDSYIKVQRFDQNTTQHDAEAALQAAGVEYTVKQVYNSPAAAGCVADFDFTGYSDSDYYYISGTRTPELSISGGAAQQPADTPKEPARDPEPDKPAGKATLSITSRPNKTSYYIGDKLNTAGLTARYTDASGKAQTITSGFTTNADLSSAGSKQVTVTYQGVSTTFNVTVKTPSVTVTQEELNEGLRLYATTDPAGQDVTWSSSNTSVAYFEGKTLHAAGSGTAVISATMTYNGRKYSGSTTVVVGDRMDKEEPANYSFKIYCNLYDLYNAYLIDSNIPGFNALNVTWSVTPADADWSTVDGGAYVDSTITCTVTASYVYNGRTYTDSMKQAADQVKYTFNIVPVYPVTGDRLVFRIETNIPNFNAANVQWAPGPAAVTGWVEGGQYVIDRTSLSANISYWLYAIYFYNGVNYTTSISISSDQ
ncbi:MAG: PASTA domain-containing protein [Oscillospiraceae bacterium]